jgi:hemoglobin
MRWLHWLTLLTLGLLLFTGGPGFQENKVSAAEEETAKSVSHEVIDDRVHRTLIKVHNEAAGLYNTKKYTEAYFLFRGALLAVQPLLDHHPGYKQAIDVRFGQSNAEPSMDSRAWRLYECVADLEDLLGPKMRPPVVDGKTLWDRFGEERVRKIVGEFVDDILQNPGVNFSRDGKYKMTPSRSEELKKRMVELASEAMGGPLKYSGKPMSLIHEGMNIKAEEFTTLVSRLELKLMRYGIEEEDRKKVLNWVESTRKNIVAGKQPLKIPVIPPPAPNAAPRTLWERLRGEEGAKKIVDDFLDPALEDPKVNFFRGGPKMGADQIKAMKSKFVDLISHYGGGPRTYNGRAMLDIHRLMGITDAEFDRMLLHLSNALEKNQVGSEDMVFMLGKVKEKRSDIVSGKKAAPPAAPASPRPAGPKNSGAPNEPAADKPKASTDRAAKVAIDRAIKAMGGEERLTHALKGCTWKARGTLIYQGNPNPVTTEVALAGLDRYRAMFKTEIAGQELEVVAVLNRDKAWRTFPQGGELEKDDLANEQRVAYLLAVSALIVPLKGNGFVSTSAGEEKFENKTAALLKVVGPDGKESTLYLDSRTGLPVKQTARVNNLMGQEVTQETLFSNYKEMSGIQKAAKTIITRDGEKYLELDTTEFKILDKVDAKNFESP